MNPGIARIAVAVALSAPGALVAADQAGTYSVQLLTPETALIAAQAALKKCRDAGYQVAVAVVDRSGVAQVMLRDRFAGMHTAEVSVNKAWTAVSFRTDTGVMAEMTQPGRPSSGIRAHPRAIMVGGGNLIETGGSMLGAIGVSGAPTGDADEMCAKAGIAAIRDRIDF